MNKLIHLRAEENNMQTTNDLPPFRAILSDPTRLVERECAEPSLKQRDVALTYALAIRDENLSPVDWKRVNEAIVARWPRGLERVKKMAWAHFRKSGGDDGHRG
jgi:hypothetical protein